MREVEHDAGIVRIILDDEQGGIAGHNLLAVVEDRLDRLLGDTRRGHRPGYSRGRTVRTGAPRWEGRTDVFCRQIERECAAAAGRTAQLNFAAEQVRELAADGEAEARAAVFAAGAGVGLLECFEDDLLFFRWDADTGIRYFERHD